MKELRYRIADESGLHARPAGQLVQTMMPFQCGVRIGAAGKMVDAKRIVSVMGLGVRQGEELLMDFDGPDEEEAFCAAETFLRRNL